MKEILRIGVIVALVVFALVLVFGFSVNGKLGSTELDFSINGVPRYEPVAFGEELYIMDRRTGEARLLRGDGRRQVGRPFRKMDVVAPVPAAVSRPEDREKGVF